MERLTAPWVSQFISQLAAAGFNSYREGRDTLLLGSLTVPWLDPAAKTWQYSCHEIEIRLGPGFPFQKPAVRPIGDEAVRGTRHQEPGDDGYLCLWRDSDWDPATPADKLLARTAEWIRHYHRNDWPPEDAVPDLHLYYPAEGARRLMITGRDWPPTQGDSGRFYVWDAGSARSFAGPPVERGKRFQPLNDPASGRYGVDPDRTRGHDAVWIHLQREPQPLPTLGQMLGEIDDARGVPPGTTRKEVVQVVWSGRPRGTVMITIALGYPGLHGGRHWLFLRSAVDGLGRKRHPGSTAIDHYPVEAYEAAPSSPDALMRRVGHMAHALHGSHAVVFGVGALGGQLALLLAEDGVTKITLVDSDRLRPGNTVRHVAGLRYSGDFKATAVRDVILDHAPYCDVVIKPASWDPNEIRSIVNETRILVDATGNRQFGQLLNSICIAQRVPLIVIASHRRGAIGRVRLIRAGKDACVECYEGPYGYAETGESGYMTIPPADDGEFLEEGCGQPTVETSSTDVVAIAAMGARAVRDVLADNYPLDGGNHLLLVQDRIEGAIGLLADVGSHYQSFRPVAGCRICGTTHA